MTTFVRQSADSKIVPRVTSDSRIAREETANGKKSIDEKVPQWEGDDCHGPWELRPSLPLVVAPRREIATTTPTPQK